jgi:hypothetical protein
MPTVIEQLKELKSIKPRPQWVESQRDLLLSQITRQNTAIDSSSSYNYWLLFKSILPSGFIKFIARPVGILSALAVIVFGTGAFGVNASKSSLPGDFLYPVKLTSEKVTVGLASSGQEKAKAHVTIAEERVREIEAIVKVEQSANTKKDKVKIAVDGLKKEMESVKRELGVAQDIGKSSKNLVTTAKEVDAKIEQITDKVKTVKTNQSVITGEQTGRVGDPVKEIIKKLNEVTIVAEETGVKAVEVLVDTHKAGNSSMSDKEVVVVLEKKINNTESNVKDVTARVTQVGAVVKDIIQTTLVGDPTSPENKAIDVQNNISIENKKIMVEIQDKPVQAEKILTEAKELLNQGDLKSVMEKVRQSAEIIKNVTTQVDNLQINVAPAKTETLTPTTPTTIPTTPLPATTTSPTGTATTTTPAK